MLVPDRAEAGFAVTIHILRIICQARLPENGVVLHYAHTKLQDNHTCTHHDYEI